MVSRPLVPSKKATMPTIKARKQANGSTRYTAVVRLRRGTTVLHQVSRTFTHRTAALSWAKHREVALEDPAELTRKQLSTPTLAELIRWYIETFETISRWQRSKQTHLKFLERHSLGKTVTNSSSLFHEIKGTAVTAARLYMRAFGAYRAAARLAVSGQLYETAVLRRSLVEHAVYAWACGHSQTHRDAWIARANGEP